MTMVRRRRVRSGAASACQPTHLRQSHLPAKSDFRELLGLHLGQHYGVAPCCKVLDVAGSSLTGR